MKHVQTLAMNNRRTRIWYKIVFGQIGVSLVITAIALFAIFYAEGYRFNYKNFKVIHTGVIYFSYAPSDASISVNGDVERKWKTAAKNVSPGFYNISVLKDGYVSWNVSLAVQPKSVNIYKNIILFRKDVSVGTLTDQRKIDTLQTSTSSLAGGNRGLVYNNNEIWISNQLVTRFSQPIQSAIWYSDNSHIVYQQGKEIRIIDTNGLNDTLLVTLSSPTRTSFSIGNNGSEIYYIDASKYKVATIR